MSAHDHETISSGACTAFMLVEYVNDALECRQKPKISAELYDAGAVGRFEITSELHDMLHSVEYAHKLQAIAYVMNRTEIVHGLLGYKRDGLRAIFSKARKLEDSSEEI